MSPELLLSRAEQEAMVEQWRSYAYQMAWKFYRGAKRWMTDEECMNTAVEGLWEAARRFQPSKGYVFSTYATWWVRQTLQRAKRDAMGIGCHLSSGSEGFERAMKTAMPASLNADRPGKDGKGGSLAATIAAKTSDPVPCFPDDFWDRVNKWLQPRLQEVIRLRYREGLTLEETGELLGITRERIRQLEAKALDMIERRVDFGDCLDQFTFQEHAIL